MGRSLPPRTPRWSQALALGLLAFVVGVVLGCVTADCSNGACVCPPGASCEFECDAPPCHVECEGDNPECEGSCANGDCNCGPGSNCEFECDAPPCHVECEPGSDCVGDCANGNCTCELGSSCAFGCDAGPCHVDCVGDNPSCDGTCANGSCTCGPNSACAFICSDHNCGVNCGEGSSCVLTCPTGDAGGQGCRFDSCAAGEPTLCPDGLSLVCGDAPCPS